MSLFGRAAILAAEACKADKAIYPGDAWLRAMKACSPKKSTWIKSCPKEAFLGLCEAGLVVGISSGNYAGGNKNKRYAIEAARLLSSEPNLAGNLSALWRRITGGTLEPNNQMSVVVALWNEGLIAPA